MNSIQRSSADEDRVAQVACSTLIVVGGLATAFVVGLIRQRIVAQQFGTSTEFDAYTAADGVSELFVQALAVGTLIYAFTPIYIQFLESNDRASASKLASQLAHVLLLLATLAAGLAAIAAPTLVTAPWGIGPGYSAYGQALIVGLLRILMVSMVIFTLSSLVTGILHAHRQFWLPTLSPTVYYLGIIFGALVLAQRMGIYGVAWGAVVGSAFHLLIQVPGLLMYRVRWTPVFDLKDPTLRRVFVLMAPRVIDLIMARATITWLSDNLSSYLGEGRLSALGTAYRIINIPWTLVATALGFAIFPLMSSLAAQHDVQAQRKALSGGLRAVLTLTFPAAVGLLVLGRPLIRVLFEGGRFTAESTSLVYFALQFYVLALISQSMLEIVVRAFAAQQDTYTPLFVSFFTTAINVGLAIWLTRPIAQGGIEQGGPALANGVAVGVEAITGLVILHIRWHGIDALHILVDAAKALAASALMGAAVWLVQAVISTGPLITVAIGLAVGLVVYMSSALALGISEIRTVPALIAQRILQGGLRLQVGDD